MEADSRAQAIYLKDYTPPHFAIAETRLEFFLDPQKTRVIAEIDFEPKEHRDLELNGEDLRMLSISINGKELSFGDITIEDGLLTIDKSAIPKTHFTLRSEVEINPKENTSLDGLYLSNDMYCTQCEAEGFRKITFYPDRPDVMTTFRVKIHSDLPVQLSNGNLISSADGVVEWHDPWPKPCYLFALVAGELEHISDTFKTASGRDVDLRIYVRKGDENRCDYAMDALKRSMKWDEETYGREYDLDLFMIVAVDDFNMGAMENKGLNIFNSKLVLATPETATDADYAAIEAVIAHEYFHNWTGNRITCRDWFQLSLKEGLTVYRDHTFSADERSASVQRIEAVMALRARQFAEDNGPLAHPVRPESYVQINNFYTATIYEKGAELIGMMHEMVGAENYRKALDLYFDRHDGQACTIEHWLQVFEDTTGRDLNQFKLWYSQSGTPVVHVNTEHDGQKLIVSIRQELTATPGQSKKKPMLIPLKFAIYSNAGETLENGVIELLDWDETHTFEVPEGAQLSINQGFSAPIILKQTPFDAAFFAAHDNDDFNRWQALRQMALNAYAGTEDAQTLAKTIGDLLENKELEPAYRALLLSLPGFSEIVTYFKSIEKPINPDEISAEQSVLKTTIAQQNASAFERVYKAMRKANDKDLSAEAAGMRSLANAALGYLSAIDDNCTLAKTHFTKSKLMTDKVAALATLVKNGNGNEQVDTFYKKYGDDRLLVDKWLMIQAMNAPAETALETVKNLVKHACFANPNPNRFRSLYGAFASGNPAAFHASDGSGYALFADALIEFDAKNPQTAARMSTAFQSWRDFDEGRQVHAKAHMERIAQYDGLSENLNEMVTRLLVG